ncbi:MAG: SIR2 family protein [Bacteroidetes bacterium]|nr:SIR2 family protein [Bacteroidota bacterium]
MIAQKYRRVFILGSGFSKSVSSTMPTLKELTIDLLNINDKKNFYELTGFIKETLSLANQLDEITTIENISSVILSKGLFYNTEEKIYYDILRHQLLRWIFERIEAHAPEVDPEKRVPLSRFFAERSSIYGTNPSDNLSLFITFNYDLLLERLLLQQVEHNWAFDYIIRLNQYLSDSHSGETHHNKLMFEYLKLHGSLNWFTAPGADRNDLSNVYRMEEEDPSRYLIHLKDIPVYIPMAFAKSEFFVGSLYNVLWNIARRCLEETDEINFIGYGFPQTDMDNLFFFLKFKSKIRDIVIREPDKSSKIKRLKRLFPESRIINCDAFEYIQEHHA